MKFHVRLMLLIVVSQWVYFAGEATWAKPYTIGTNYTTSILNDSKFFPPDTMGTVGNDHVVTLINGLYRVHDKQGNQIQSQSLNDFWTDAGQTPTEFAFDPRVIFDTDSERYFAVSVDNHSKANHFLVAVSNTSDPTDGWTGFKVDSDTDNKQWADFPQMGINKEGLFISAKMLSLGGGVQVNQLIIPKADLVAVVPTVANATLLENMYSTLGSKFYWQAVVDQDGTNMPAMMFSESQGTTSDFIKLAKVNEPINSPTVSLFKNIPVANYSGPSQADQPLNDDGTPVPDLHSGDARIGSRVILQNGIYWGVHGVADPVTRNSSVRWFKIDADTDTLLEEGLIADDDLDLIYPSVAVNEMGDVVIGFTGSSLNQYASSMAIIGETDDLGQTTFDDDLILLKEGVSTYLLKDGRSRNRWGDYSAVSVDPNDPESFWVFQEWAFETGVTTSGDPIDRWAVQVTQLIVPEPASLMLLGMAGLMMMRKRGQDSKY